MHKKRIAPITNRLILCTAMVLAIESLCPAQSILDQQLGPAAPDKKDAAPTNSKNADTAPPPAPGIDPKAAKALDDTDLVNKLTNTGTPDPAKADPQEAFSEMLDRMGQSQTRLSGKDVGSLTQETQRRIVTNLDTLIEYARKQQQQSQSQSKPKPQPKPGEKREMSKGQQQSPGKPSNNAAKESSLTRGSVETPQSNGESMRNKGPAEWGGLRPQDREMISNGVNEQYLPAYRDMIDRYYQALAEIGKSKER